MKKLKLNLAQEAGEILNREELKNILGGATGSAAGICDNKPTHLKCVDKDEKLIKEWDSVGCPNSNQCAEGLYMSCACTNHAS